MKTLAIESSGVVASVALLEDGKCIGEYTTNHKQTHSQTLVPMLDQLRTMLQFEMKEIDSIAISKGPGSFTGLRIGSATAKGLGLALNCPLVEVSTLQGLAYNLYGCAGIVCPMMDARRNQVYTAAYRFVKNENHGYDMKELLAPTALDLNTLIAELANYEEPVTFLGDGAVAYKEALEQNCKFSFTYAPAASMYQRAASIAALGERFFREGKGILAKEHQPEYLRKSQAEREREEGRGPATKIEHGHS